MMCTEAFNSRISNLADLKNTFREKKAYNS